MGNAVFYHPIVEVGPREDGAAILAGFQEIVKKGIQSNFRLLNYYKSLPLTTRRLSRRSSRAF